MFFQRSFLTVLLAGIGVAFFFIFAFAVQLEDKNIELKKKTQAPFGDSMGAPQVGETAAEHAGDLSLATVGSRELADHLKTIVSESLTFDKSTYTYTTESARRFFTPEGYAQYLQFLDNSLIQKTMETKPLQTGVLVGYDPLLLNSGVYNGVFKWLFEVPITVSFIPKETETYEETGTGAQNRSLTLKVQFTRTADKDTSDRTKIEIWQGRLTTQQ